MSEKHVMESISSNSVVHNRGHGKSIRLYTLQGLVHFTHVTWPARLVPSLSFWVMIGRSPRRDCSGSSSPIPTRTGPTYQNFYISGYAGSSYHNLLSPTNRPFHYWHMVVHVSFQTKKPIFSQCPGRHSPP